MKYAYCLEMLYDELSFIDRLAEAKKDGIETIEFWDWRNKDLELLKQQLKKLNMHVSNLSGNRNYGMIDPSERKNFLKEVKETGLIAKSLGCHTLMLLVQKLESDNSGKLPAQKLTNQQMEDNIIESGKAVGKLADELAINIVIEPLNDVLDHPHYFLTSSSTAFKLIKAINHPRVKILYDIYHLAMQGENVLEHIKNNLQHIGYFHVADKPGRNEPGSGEIDYPAIWSLLKKMNYQGIIGFEYMPSNGDSKKAVRATQKIFK